MSDGPNYTLCFVIYLIGHVLGFGALTFLGLWINFDGKGFGFRDKPELEFRFHPILMAISLLFLNGEAIMIYRGLRFWPKYLTKFIHAALHTVNFVLMVLAIRAVWESHDNSKDQDGNPSPISHALTPHSWVGLSTASLYGVQYVGGLLFFYLPTTPIHVRKAFMPIHRAAGLLSFALCLAAALMGSGEHSAWNMQCEDPHAMCTENLYANLYCVFLLGYAGCVFSIAVVPEWARKPLADELPPLSIINYQEHQDENGTSAWTTNGVYKSENSVLKTSL